MFDDDELTSRKKRKSRLPGDSESLFKQMENSSLDEGKFTKKFADNTKIGQRGGLRIEGGSRGPIRDQKGKGSFQSAAFIGDIKWTPAQKTLIFLLSGGSYAGMIIAIYLTGNKAIAVILGSVIMLLFLFAYIIHWITKG